MVKSTDVDNTVGDDRKSSKIYKRKRGSVLDGCLIGTIGAGNAWQQKYHRGFGPCFFDLTIEVIETAYYRCLIYSINKSIIEQEQLLITQRRKYENSR